MKNTLLILLCAVLLLSSCDDNLHEKIISTFPNGTPTKVEFYKLQDNVEILVKHIRFYENGEKREEGHYMNDLKHGEWTYWYENGNIWSKGFFNNGLRDGATNVYYKSGKPQYEGFYSLGETDGKWIFWDSEGIKVKEVYYEKGKLVDENVISD